MARRGCEKEAAIMRDRSFVVTRRRRRRLRRRRRVVRSRLLDDDVKCVQTIARAAHRASAGASRARRRGAMTKRGGDQRATIEERRHRSKRARASGGVPL